MSDTAIASLGLHFLKHFDFSRKKVCVTGAGSGIGKATAELFAALGATVYLADKEQESIAEMASNEPKLFKPKIFDQAHQQSIEELVASVQPLDILINNAGVVLATSLDDLHRSDLDRVVSINFSGAMMLTQLVGSAMAKGGSGTIVHTSSQLILNGAPNRAVYAATKAGISQFVKAAAAEWGRFNVRVNGIAPGRTLTPMNHHYLRDDKAKYDEGLRRIPLGRYGQPEDIAAAIVFLSSGASAYVTGTTLVADGGWTLY